jgi:two-component system, OmpR family, sensor histidine kinase PhoQ
MMRSPPSVSRRLLIAVTLPLLLFFVLTGWAIDYVFRQQTQAAIRERLEEQVVALVTAVDLDLDGNLVINQLDPEKRLEVPHSGQYASLRDENGKLIWNSPSLSGMGLTLGTRLPVGGVDYRSQVASDGSTVAALSRGLQWLYGNGLSKKLVFTVADSIAPQMQQLATFRRRMAGWFGGLAVALLATMAGMMRGALAPVRRMEQEIAAVESGAALSLGGGYPRELQSVTAGLNALLQSERNRIARYRDTLGNLAHSLKTPLAVVRASLEGLHTDTARASATIGNEVDRMAQIVAHQLKRAAAAGGTTTLGHTPLPLLPSLTDLRVAMLKVHARKDLRLDLDVPPECAFLGDSGDILEVLGNVVDNACKWCRSTVRVRVRLDPARDLRQRLSIVVEDDGPGIAPENRSRVIERGVRADEHVPGHGLGLAMVRETAGLYGGRLLIDASPELKGARVELQLPGRQV